MLFDEPTSALDPISTSKVEDLIVELKSKLTIVIVTHNMQQAARISDFTAFMYLGELIEYDRTEKSLPILLKSLLRIISLEGLDKNGGPMVRIALNRELQILQSLLYDMAKVVDEMVRGVIFSYQKRDRLRAEEMIKLDDQVDHYEHLINITALEIIALQQPVAKDLRRVISVLEIARNLERTMDQAVNIAEMLLEFEEEGELIEKNVEGNFSHGKGISIHA